jgi:hypothetical protein
MNTSEMKLKSVPANRISLGGIALILAGIAVLVAILLSFVSMSKPLFSQELENAPNAEQLQVALEATTFAYRLGLALAPVYWAFLALGMIALYAYLSPTRQEKLAFAGMVVTVFFLALFLPIIGFAAYVFPAIGELVAQGQTEMIAVMDQVSREPFIIIPFFGGILWYIGLALMGAAIWRSGVLWKWGGLLLIINGVLSIPAFVLDITVLNNVAGTVGGIGLIGLGISLLRSDKGGNEK